MSATAADFAAIADRACRRAEPVPADVVTQLAAIFGPAVVEAPAPEITKPVSATPAIEAA